MANLKQGMSGNEVKELQQALIDKGYNVGITGADGVFGKNTLAAVKLYQTDNGLQVDGIAGKNTLGSLYGTGAKQTNTSTGAQLSKKGGNTKTADVVTTPTVTPSTETPAETPATTKPLAYGNLTDEDTTAYQNLIGQAWDTLQQLQANKPGEYSYSADYGIANDYLNQYQNRDPFSYDFNSDALYQQYKDQYIQQGQMAMMDTMGQAAAMTGGYGNSYAQTAGQQAYNQYLNQLNEIMPELYQMAYDRYTQEGQELLNMYEIYMDRESDNYSRYLDSVDLWNQDVTNARNNYTDLYNEYTDAYDMDYTQKETERQWTYQEDRDKVEDDQWQQEFDYEKQQNQYNRLYGLITSSGYTPSEAELNAAGMTEAEATALKSAYTNGLTSGNTNGNTGGNTSGRETTASQEEINAIIKDFERCENADELLYRVTDLILRGYGEAWVTNLAKRYDKWTDSGGGIGTKVPLISGLNSNSLVRSENGGQTVGDSAFGNYAKDKVLISIR